LLADVADTDALGLPDHALLARWGPDVLAAAGVLTGVGLVRDEDVPLDDTADHDLDGELDWVEAVSADLPAHDLPPVLPELLAVRDLDLVRDDAWPRVLAVLAADPGLRDAVVGPARVLLGDGRRVDVASYTGWWLREHARLDGRPPTELALGPAGGDLAGLYAEVSSGLDRAFLTAIGVRTSVESLLAEPDGADELLDRLADVSRPVSAAQLARLYDGLSRLDPSAVSPPELVRVRPDLVVASDRAVVLDAPQHLQLPWPAPPLLAPLDRAAALAEVLELPTTGGRLGGVDLSGGEARDLPAVVRRVLPDGPTRWWEHERLVVGGHDADWWVGPDLAVHACTVDGLARGLAWAAGRWGARLLLAAAIAEPARVDELLAEVSLEP
ncbi:MAG TPA: hypothetical protein VLW53_04350, partial [Candidatus Eisenbacteria bacterium]|nr:hypothetical protein [Candidatus Eisenbacteria bacterium]